MGPARGEPVEPHPSAQGLRQAQDERTGGPARGEPVHPSTGSGPSTSSGRTDLRARTRHTRPVRGEPVHPSTSSGRTGVVGVLRQAQDERDCGPAPATPGPFVSFDKLRTNGCCGRPSTGSGPSTSSGRTDAVADAAADSPLTRRRPSDWRGASRVCLSAARPPQAARSRRCPVRL